MAICAHFIDSKNTRRVVLLAVRRLYGCHSGWNYASLVGDVLRKFGVDLEEKIGWFVLDNATTNDAAVKILLTDLFS